MIKSLLHGDKIGYEFSGNDSWGERGVSVVDALREYPTYGDGTVKHGNSYKVGADNFVDCLVSLYDYLTASNGNTPITREEELKKVESSWPNAHTPGDKLIAFYAGLKFVAGKPRYYEKNELKTSTSESKGYDKRWEAVPDWADGSFDATWRFIKGHSTVWDYAGMFWQFESVKTWYDNNHGYGFSNAYERNGIGTDTEYNDVCSAFYLIHNLIEAYRHKDRAKRTRESLQWNLVGRHEQEKAA